MDRFYLPHIANGVEIGANIFPNTRPAPCPFIFKLLKVFFIGF